MLVSHLEDIISSVYLNSPRNDMPQVHLFTFTLLPTVLPQITWIDGRVEVGKGPLPGNHYIVSSEGHSPHPVHAIGLDSGTEFTQSAWELLTNDSMRNSIFSVIVMV